MDNNLSQDTHEKYHSRSILKDENGTYRWIYSSSMWKNYSMIKPVLKVFVVCFLLILAVILFAFFQSGRDTGGLTGILILYMGIVLLILLISVLSYAFVAVLYGGKYVAFYEMDPEGISHYQPASQAEKEKAIGLFTAAAGLLGGNPGISIAGLTAGSRLVVRADFSKVLSLKIIPEKEEIRVHSFMTWHTVHVYRENFDFVADYMTKYCTKANIKIL